METNFIKHSISFHYQHIYARQKRKNWIYRITFFGLGCVFFTLGMIYLFKTTNFTCGMCFKHHSMLIKDAINLFCLALAGGSFACGYWIHPEKEAIRYLLNKIEKEMKAPKKNIQIEFNAVYSKLTEQ